jgi:predicted TPR repeat methyltransferase
MVLRKKYAGYLAEAGRTDDAIAEYEKIIAAEPDQKEAADALAQLRSAKNGEKTPGAP